MGEKEAKFTSMKYTDAKITTTLHMCALNYFLQTIFQLDPKSITFNHQYTCSHHTISCNWITEYLETRLVLQDTVSKTAMRIHFYKNVPGSEWTHVSVTHLSDRPSTQCVTNTGSVYFLLKFSFLRSKNNQYRWLTKKRGQISSNPLDLQHSQLPKLIIELQSWHVVTIRYG
jgi:hypothetical protein